MPGLGRRARFEQLAAGDDEVHARDPRHVDEADPGRGQRGQPRHGQDVAGPGQHVARVHVLAAAADVQAGGDGGGRDDGVAPRLGVLDLEHRVGAGRDRGAGRDPRGGAGLERDALGAARGQVADHAQLGAGRDVRRADRVAVHRRAVERRQVDHRARLGGEHAADGG